MCHDTAPEQEHIVIWKPHLTHHCGAPWSSLIWDVQSNQALTCLRNEKLRMPGSMENTPNPSPQPSDATARYQSRPQIPWVLS